MVNALGAKVADSVASIYRVIQTFDDTDGSDSNKTLPDLSFLSERILYTQEEAYKSLPTAVQQQVENILKFTPKFYTSRPLYDANIGRPQKIIEQVTPILESLLSAVNIGHGYTLALSFSNRSIPILTNSSTQVFKLMERTNAQVLLMGKTKRMSSISDWHDLQIVALQSSNKTTQEWLRIVNTTYMLHAARPHFTMLDPRPAILEANLQLRKKLKVEFFDDNAVCAWKWENGEFTTSHHHSFEDPNAHNGFRYIHDHHLEHFHDRRCSGRESIFEIFCGSGDIYEDHVCAQTGDPITWKAEVGPSTSSIKAKLDLNEKKWATELPDAMEDGSLRYRLSTDASEPGKYCWDSGQENKEKRKKALIYDHFDKTRTFIAKDWKNVTNKVKAVVMTGDLGSWRNLDKFMYQSLGKQYYAKRHDYDFVFQFSNQFTPYYPHDLFKAVGRPDAYFKGVMSKTLMTMDTMYKFPDADWIIFLDSDAWINAEWLDTPLDAFVEDVSPDKVWVQTNYRSMLTGAFLVRNNEAGRRLVRDWVAVGMSGQVSCHGFDQAALMIVFMLEQAERIVERPFGLSCLANDQKSSESGLYGTGCSGSDWSCDYKFEKVMNYLGYKTRQNMYFNDSFSSYSRGCANDYVKKFHVSYETNIRPRLQCFHCGKTYEIESLEWDGPLGGANEKVRAGAVNSYFSNHKANWLFHEQYLDPKACKKLQFLELCSLELSKSHEEADKNTNDAEREELYSKHVHGRRLVSLTDSIAIDFDTGVFCKLSDKSLQVQLQKATTYMKDYPNIIKAAKGYNQSFWDHCYRTQGQCQSRSFCSKEKIDEGKCGKDGLNWRDKDSNWFLAKSTVCSGCKVVENEGLDPTGKKKAVDCSNNN